MLRKVQEAGVGGGETGWGGEMGWGAPDFTAAVTARLGTNCVPQQPRQQQGTGDPGLLQPF